MKKKMESEKINRFVMAAYRPILMLVDMTFESNGFKIKDQIGHGLGHTFILESPKYKASRIEFRIHNLLMDIATKDRDAEYLEFDEGLMDDQYLLDKTIKNLDRRIYGLIATLENASSETLDNEENKNEH